MTWWVETLILFGAGAACFWVGYAAGRDDGRANERRAIEAEARARAVRAELWADGAGLKFENGAGAAISGTVTPLDAERRVALFRQRRKKTRGPS